MAYCKECGHQLDENAKFCSECGAKVAEKEQRKIEYDGKVHKCPNCGEVLQSFLPICPSCGYELRDTRVSNSLQEFTTKLEQIEAERETKKQGFLNSNQNTLTKTDEQKISLIKSFSIPNTKEDIFEFMILASSNINTKWWLEGNTDTVAQEAESSAWLAKFEQAYQKAEIQFEDDPAFEKIKKLCFKNYIVYGYIPQSVLKEHIEQQIKELKGKKNG